MGRIDSHFSALDKHHCLPKGVQSVVGKKALQGTCSIITSSFILTVVYMAAARVSFIDLGYGQIFLPSHYQPQIYQYKVHVSTCRRQTNRSTHSTCRTLFIGVPTLPSQSPVSASLNTPPTPHQDTPQQAPTRTPPHHQPATDLVHSVATTHNTQAEQAPPVSSPSITP
jgi:hypothetical protein